MFSRNETLGRRALFFPHCKMEPAWGRDFDFAIDVSATYDRKKRALAEYRSIFTVDSGDELLRSPAGR